MAAAAALRDGGARSGPQARAAGADRRRPHGR